MMRTLYDGMSFEVIREAATFNNGSFSTNWSTEQVTAGNSSTVRDGGRYRWIGEDTTTNDRYRYIGNGGETNLKPRYTGIQVTLYGRGEPVAMNRTSSSTGRGGTTYLGKDILGSVRSVTNEAGQLEDRYEYDAFGKPYRGDLDNGMNLGYMGKPYDSNTGLYNYGYRDYKPEAARFTTVDPIRDGSNWFVYVNSDPVNYTDLWGLSASDKQNNIFQDILSLGKDFLDIFSIDVKVGAGIDVEFALGGVGIDLGSINGNLSSDGWKESTTMGVSAGIVGYTVDVPTGSDITSGGNTHTGNIGFVQFSGDLSGRSESEIDVVYTFGAQAILGVYVNISGEEALDFVDKGRELFK